MPTQIHHNLIRRLAVVAVSLTTFSNCHAATPQQVDAAIKKGVAALWREAVKATTRLAAGASRRPSPTLGVGKWLAGTPIDACWRILPVAGLSPYRIPFCPMVQISPAAMMGGPPPVPELHSRCSRGGDFVTRTAMMPLTQGR